MADDNADKAAADKAVADAKAAADAAAGAGANPREIKLTQERLDELIAENHAKGARKVEARLKELFGELGVKDADELKAKLKAPAKPDASEAEKLRREIGEQAQAQIDAAKQGWQKERDALAAREAAAMKLAERYAIDTNVTAAAVELKVIPTSLSDVVQLTRSMFRMNEAGDVEAIDPKTGKVRYSTNGGNPMTFSEAMADWLSTRPQYVQAEHRAGAGQRAAASAETKAKTITRDKYNALSQDERTALHVEGGWTIQG